MSLNGNIYVTGLGATGSRANNSNDTYFRALIPGKPGSRILVNRANVTDLGAPSTIEYLVFTRVLNEAPVTAASALAGTSGITISTADFAFNSSAWAGDATDSIAADDMVVYTQTDGTYQFDMVDNVSTTGYVTLDTALPGLVDTTCKVYIMGSGAENAHTRVPMSSMTADLNGDSFFEIAVGYSKGDPMVITNYPTSSSGVKLDGVLYTYVNK